MLLGSIVVFFRPAWLFGPLPSRLLEQLKTNEVADHVMDDACAFAKFYLWQKWCTVRVGAHAVLEGEV